jgi:hypothetical protein
VRLVAGLAVDDKLARAQLDEVTRVEITVLDEDPVNKGAIA